MFITEMIISRTSLLQDIQKEEQHRKWYFDQMLILEEKINSLPLNDNVNILLNDNVNIVLNDAFD
jgi:hypothetical protein